MAIIVLNSPVTEILTAQRVFTLALSGQNGFSYSSTVLAGLPNLALTFFGFP